jgi:hypothetical protein
VCVLVGAGGSSVCGAAESFGYTPVTTYVPSATVLCVGTAGGFAAAVADDGLHAYGTIACSDINAGAFPSVAVTP